MSLCSREGALPNNGAKCASIITIQLEGNTKDKDTFGQIVDVEARAAKNIGFNLFE